jgi:hypothetical protein
MMTTSLSLSRRRRPLSSYLPTMMTTSFFLSPDDDVLSLLSLSRSDDDQLLPPLMLMRPDPTRHDPTRPDPTIRPNPTNQPDPTQHDPTQPNPLYSTDQPNFETTLVGRSVDHGEVTRTSRCLFSFVMGKKHSKAMPEVVIHSQPDRLTDQPNFETNLVGQSVRQ